MNKSLQTFVMKCKRYWTQKLRNLALFLCLWAWKGGEDVMATIYVTLIVRGYKTYAEVPDLLKPEVKRQLEALELGQLAE